MDLGLARLGTRLLFNMYHSRPPVIGREHLEGLPLPYLVASNHSSLIDPGLLVGFFPAPLRFLAKESLFQAPWLGWVMRQMDNIPLSRDGTDVGAIKRSLRLLKPGNNSALAVFIEGSRRPHEVAEAKAGVAYLASKAQVPVVPVYIHGSDIMAPPGTIVPTFYPIELRVGAPIRIPPRGEGVDLEAESERIRQAILSLSDQGVPGGEPSDP